MSVKPPLVYSWVVFFPSVDKLYIWTSLSFWCHLVYKMLFPYEGLSTRKQNTGLCIYTFFYMVGNPNSYWIKNISSSLFLCNWYKSLPINLHHIFFLFIIILSSKFGQKNMSNINWIDDADLSDDWTTIVLLLIFCRCFET